MTQTHQPINQPHSRPRDGELYDNVRPKDWVNPEPRDPYHLLVIGAGPAGLGRHAARPLSVPGLH